MPYLCAVLSYTALYTLHAIPNKCRLCIEQKVLTNSLQHSSSLIHFTSRHPRRLPVCILNSVLLSIVCVHCWVHNAIDELLCAWVRYWLRFRVCLCQVYVRHKSARFYTLRFLLLRCLLLLLLFRSFLRASPLHIQSIFFISLLFTMSWSVRFHSQFSVTSSVCMQHMCVVLERR